MGDVDHEKVSRVITEALSGPGGVALVVNVFAGIPGVVHAPAKRGMFRSEPERILIGDWRYDGNFQYSHTDSRNHLQQIDVTRRAECRPRRSRSAARLTPPASRWSKEAQAGATVRASTPNFIQLD